MRNMGGLRKKMPITFWTFLLGGLALSGLPLITAGFWSKDEIFAEAWHLWSRDGALLALIVFIMLALAAFLTAYYTMRQISLTFFGDPRTPLAENAHESSPFMTVPMVLLAVFAVVGGWIGIPESFPVVGPIANYNYFHHFVGSTIYKLMEELYELGLVNHPIETLPAQWEPITASFVVALGGLFLGWWVYGRRPLERGEPDPVEKPLGPLYTFLNHKWYFDELYQRAVINPTIYLSEEVVYKAIDQGVIDGILHGTARAFYGFGYYVKRFEEVVISNGVDSVKDAFLNVAREFRQLQTGRVQEYALISALIAVALITVVLLINSGYFSQLF
jgi:NADH-quinone oxidoreductase subunit L